jgi:hypothetical protein
MKKKEIARKKKYQTLFSEKAVARIILDDAMGRDFEEDELGPGLLMTE